MWCYGRKVMLLLALTSTACHHKHTQSPIDSIDTHTHTHTHPPHLLSHIVCRGMTDFIRETGRANAMGRKKLKDGVDHTAWAVKAVGFIYWKPCDEFVRVRAAEDCPVWMHDVQKGRGLNKQPYARLIQFRDLEMYLTHPAHASISPIQQALGCHVLS